MEQRESKKVEITRPIDIVALTEEVENTNAEVVLQREGRDAARLVPIEDVPDDDEGQPFTHDDPLWSIVGIFRSEGPGDVSENKHKYLAEAYLSHSKDK